MSTAIFTDTMTVFNRELRPLRRDPLAIIFGMIQPLIFLGLFSPLLPDGSLQWFVPGIVVMTCLFSTSFAGSALMAEMQTGAHERMLVAPIARSALLVGRALKEIVPTFAQTAIILLIVTPFSFELHLPGVVLGLIILAIFGVGIGALSYSLAIVAEGQDWLFWTVQQTLLFPMLLLAGILLPVDHAPGWLQAMSDCNPLTYIVNAERALFAGTIGADAAWGLVAALGVAALGLILGVRAMRKTV
ncbi:MAG: ABC transporter permease [Corynebacteriales bacterium]|nr:ABC transporter permease [Mycobacteriales bacterium]